MFSSSQGSIRSSVKPSYVPKTMSNLFEGLSKVDSLSDRFFVLNDYLEKYKEELSKVNSLKLDLPQCMLLLMDAVKTLEEEVENVWNEMKSQLNEKPTEFSPVHGRGDLLRDGESYLREKDVCNFGEGRGVCRLDRGEMKDNSIVDAIGIELCKIRNRGHATLNLNRSPAVTESNSVECIKPGSLRVKTNHQQRDFQFKSIPKSPSRNPRRSWTAELHNRFLEALEHLRGPEVATPRKIREAMKMDGLTNDQVKSHLQVMEVDLILKTNKRLKEHVNLRSIGFKGKEIQPSIWILPSIWRWLKIPDSAIDKLVAGRQSNPELLGKSRSYDR